MNLSAKFAENMQTLFDLSEAPGGFDDFARSFDKPPVRGLRVNTLKISPDELKSTIGFQLEKVKWCAEGFAYPAGERPAKNWRWNAGLYYIQEPGAMAPAELLGAWPGERILDLCAAPGGKSLQLAAKMKGNGLLVLNDASASRCLACVRNLEQAGVENAVVVCEKPHRLSGRLQNFFDGVLVDAPCSGEGMFRRDPAALKAWGENKPEACAKAQREILSHASRMVRPGGRLVYSTCTFNETENEEVVKGFLRENGDFEPATFDRAGLGFSAPFAGIGGAARLWPHVSECEGFFCASFIKKSGPNCEAETSEIKNGRFGPGAADFTREIKTGNAAELKPALDFFANCNVVEKVFARYFIHGRTLFTLPESCPNLRGLRVVRGGFPLGDVSEGRFSPSQALAMSVGRREAKCMADLTGDEICKYLRGESFGPDEIAPPETLDKSPYVLACAEGFPLGWAKFSGGRLKNLLPRGLAVNK